MTNIEFYKNELKDLIKKVEESKDYICKVHDVVDGIEKFFDLHPEAFRSQRESSGVVIDWLLEEHKEPFKLTQWEKDLLETYDPKYIFYNHFSLDKMKIRGYFKGVTNTSMTIQEILENCEIEDETHVKKS